MGADQPKMDEKLPEWAEGLPAVRHLPTNVGSRIRKRVHDALEKNPPAWARKRLKYSISKPVYKGNAAGPTKRAVLSVLNDVIGKHMNEQSRSETMEYHSFSVSAITMKLCCVVLRRIASLFDQFCKYFPKRLMDSSLDKRGGICDSSSSASIFDQFDFRAIDCRLAVKTYKGSHEAFFHDVQELWNNVRTYHLGGPYMVQLADIFSHLFELAYEKEVVDVVRRLNEYSESNSVSAETSREAKILLDSVAEIEIPGAPWNSGICKICGIDKDDTLVLLCDICDGEYHAYCLETPLDKVPEQDWYCPLCVSPEEIAKNASHISETQEQLMEESEASDDQLQYVPCKVCSERGSSHDMICCHCCEITFVHRLCCPDQSQVPVEDVKWVCEDCKERWSLT